MKEVFKFTADEVSFILYKELVNTGKVTPRDRFGIRTRYDHSYGKMDSLIIEITDPIPGAIEVSGKSYENH